MKTSASNILLAAALGAVAFKFANAEFLSGFPAGIVIASLAAAGILALFIAEYAKERRPVKLPRRVIRPGAPRTQGSGAYGIRRQRAIVERIAA